MRVSRVSLQVCIGLAVLALGALVYLLDRPSESVYFIPNWWTLSYALPKFYDHVPTFAHVFAFSLFTAAILDGSGRTALYVCWAWFLIEFLFEVGQIAEVATAIAALTESWFGGASLARYFIVGTFDYLDLCSIALGSVVAFATIKQLNRSEINEN